MKPHKRNGREARERRRHDAAVRKDKNAKLLKEIFEKHGIKPEKEKK